jgi:acetyl esterase/lipase
VIEDFVPKETRIIDMHVPGPAHRTIAPTGLRQAALNATPAHPNRLGSQQVPVRLYEPYVAPTESLTKPSGEPWATIVWAHGGSFVRGDLDWPESDWVAQSLAGFGVRVIAVDYALASDTVKAPASANDVAAVLRWVESRYGGAILVGGASAGAHLASEAALIQAVSAEAGIAGYAAGLVMVYPTMHRAQHADKKIARLVKNLPEVKRFSPERIGDMYAYYLAEDLLSSNTDTSELVVPEQSIPHSATAGLARDSSDPDSSSSDGTPASSASYADSGSLEYAAAGDTSPSSSPTQTVTDVSPPQKQPRTAAAGKASASLAAITELIEQIRASQSDKPSLPYEEIEEASEFPTEPVVIGELIQRRLAKLPPTVIINAEADELRASGEQFAAQLREAGVRVFEHTEAKTVHGYLNSPEVSKAARASARSTIETIIEDMRTILGP